MSYNSPAFMQDPRVGSGYSPVGSSLDTGFDSMANYGSPKTNSSWIVPPTAPPSFMPSYEQNQAYDMVDGWGGMTPQPQPGVAGNGAGGGGIFGGMFDTKDANGMTTKGWAGSALGAVQGIGNLYMGMKNYGLAKDAFNEGKRQYEQNYAAQKQTTNASLEDRQRARVASNSSAYQSVGDYMNKNGIR